MFRHYVCLASIYSCGLRFQEDRALNAADIDGQRWFLHIRGKGKKDRYVPVPQGAVAFDRIGQGGQGGATHDHRPTDRPNSPAILCEYHVERPITNHRHRGGTFFLDILRVLAVN